MSETTHFYVDGKPLATTHNESDLMSFDISYFPHPSLDPSCAIASCAQPANPLNAVEAPLDVFGSPVVRVCLCDEHYRMFGVATDEHAVPDIVIEE